MTDSPAEVREFPLPNLQTDSEAQLRSLGCIALDSKRSEREGRNLPPFIAEFKNDINCTSVHICSHDLAHNYTQTLPPLTVTIRDPKSF
jgi:hypothetical protein